MNWDLMASNNAESSMQPSKSNNKCASQSPPRKNLWAVVEDFEAGVKSYKEELDHKKHMNINKCLATSIELQQMQKKLKAQIEKQTAEAKERQ